MPRLLDEIYRLQRELTDADDHEKIILKMCANLLEDYHHVPEPKNRFTRNDYVKVPGRWELIEGMLYSD